jgi:type IV secretory pathway TraG/TraD family ATPase VirD4
VRTLNSILAPQESKETIGGVKETIASYLRAFITPDIAKVFCAGGNTFDFADIDRGKIICVAMAVTKRCASSAQRMSRLLRRRSSAGLSKTERVRVKEHLQEDVCLPNARAGTSAASEDGSF